MSTRRGIIAGGNWLVDQLKTIDRFPQEETLVSIQAEGTDNGGSAFNVLVDLARLGAGFPLAGVGLTGADAAGVWVRQRCAAHGIDTARLGTHPGAPTSYSDVMTVRATGRRTFFHQRGANAFLGPENFDFAGVEAKIFHLGYLLLLDRLDAPDPEYGTGAARVLAAARRAGCRTSVDVVSENSDAFARVVLPALPHVDYCLLNEFELERTTGLPVRTPSGGAVDVATLRQAAERLLDAGVREWVVVHYPEGACAAGPGGQFHQQGSVRLPPEKIVGTAGAGDAFAAGVLHALHEGEEISTALRQGACVAAACLGNVGCSEGVLPLPRCLELGSTHGFRT